MKLGYQIRVLAPTEAAAYQALRLQSYQDSAYAFSESYEDEVQRSIDHFQAELASFVPASRGPEGRLPPGTGPNGQEQYVLGAFNESGELAGFVKFRRDQRSKARHKSMIHAMYVAPDHRKRGLGKQLIDEVIARARKLDGLEQIHLWVLHSTASTSASEFYAKCGFQSQGIVRKDLKINGQYVDSEYMVMYFE